MSGIGLTGAIAVVMTQCISIWHIIYHCFSRTAIADPKDFGFAAPIFENLYARGDESKQLLTPDRRLMNGHV